MSLPGDPSPCAITYKLTDQGSGNYRLRRMASAGAQFHGPLDLTNANGDLLALVGDASATAEGGTFTDLR
jgi:hypothetical protein